MKPADKVFQNCYVLFIIKIIGSPVTEGIIPACAATVRLKSPVLATASQGIYNSMLWKDSTDTNTSFLSCKSLNSIKIIPKQLLIQTILGLAPQAAMNTCKYNNKFIPGIEDFTYKGSVVRSLA